MCGDVQETVYIFYKEKMIYDISQHYRYFRRIKLNPFLSRLAGVTSGISISFIPIHHSFIPSTTISFYLFKSRPPSPLHHIRNHVQLSPSLDSTAAATAACRQALPVQAGVTWWVSFLFCQA